ncbi:bifunctional YncE family protein/alkaline phosphatase family protein [Pedobacter frigidisoli]|uniref:bifunctional YncE family protein/alkaline phosphatase family protein n=1 Tax=Pedobacter frigidisoli TaxID=2530455 RepID=UPI00292D7E09|nr:bifunctional YncE family protein/alkaline phosphatase family protein [Pedobacter frigidisoli]
MKKIIVLFIISMIIQEVYAQWPGKIEHTKQVLLPNGWKLSPAGHSIPLGDLPLNMQVSPSGKYIAVTNNGQSTQSLQLIDAKSEKILDEKVLAKSWYGLAFSKDENHLYVSGGNDNIIIKFTIRNQNLAESDTIKLGEPWPKSKISPAGIAVNKSGTKLFTVTKEDSCLYFINPEDKRITQKIQLPAIAYSCVLSGDESKLYVSLWGGRAVAVVNTADEKIVATIPVGDHPNELLLNRKGNYLFVANANDNSVSVINTLTSKVIETIATTLYATQLTGSTTNGLALSANEKTLYIANADNNCLAVFDVSRPGTSESQGFIPVGWYPTSVKVTGSKILVSNGKGNTSMANPKGPQPVSKADNSGYQMGSTANNKLQYIAGLFKGSLSFIDVPKPEQLKTYTRQVYANTPFTDKKAIMADGEAGNPIPRKQGEKSPIKHVFYIIKENRTYDQVLGDMAKGNGDSTLTLFGKKITPNQHAFAENYVLLDNFYVDAEVSADGHNWSTAAYATDVVEKTWPTSYGARGGSTTFEGGRPVTYPKGGFIWDYCQRAGVSYRSYGEFGDYAKANIKSLQGHMCPASPGFDMDITDQVRADAWIHDFDSLVVAGSVPQFNTLRVSNDHTSGQKKGKVSPQSAVADNDLAVGRILERLSHSPIWKESVVFILEDDAQNGPDHVDAHRSPAYIIGPYVKRKSVVHTMYSTSGFLRTMELILGLPPMSQYDAAAVPLFECFTEKPDLTPYNVITPSINLNNRNVAVNESSRRSELFNFAKEDSAPDLDLNEVIWKSVKGENSVMPAPKRSAFVILEKRKKDDDD